MRINGERRVYDVFVGNDKLDENKLYTISVGDYLAQGGDGYSMLIKYNVTNDTGIMINDACTYYIENVLNGTIPEIYKTTQGRIVKQKKNPSNSNNFVKYFRGFSLILLALMF